MILFGVAIFLMQPVYGEVIRMSPREIIEDYFDISDNYYAAGNYKKSLEYLEMIEKFEPLNSVAKYKKAMVLNVMKQSDKAKLAFTEALTINPGFADSELAKIFQQQLIKEKTGLDISGDDNVSLPSEKLKPVERDEDGKIKNATKENFKIVQKQKNLQEHINEDSIQYNKIGLEYVQDKDLPKAIESFKLAIKADKNNVEAYNNIALVYWGMEDFPNAKKYLKKAIKINSNDSKSLLNLALLYKELKDKNGYLKYLNRAYMIDSNNPMICWSVGNYYFSEKQYKIAKNYYLKAIENNPKFYNAYYALANTFLKIGDIENAYIIFQEALNNNLGNEQLYFSLTKLALLLGRSNEAFEYIKVAIDYNASAENYLELAKIYLDLDKPDKALAIFQKFAASDNPDILHYIALCYYKMQDTNTALEYFKKTVEKQKEGNINYYYDLAQCYKTIGEEDNFNKYMQLAIKVRPKVSQDYVDLSYIYFETGNNVYAMNILDEGIIKFPNDKKLYVAKLSLYEKMGDEQGYLSFKTKYQEKFNQ